MQARATLVVLLIALPALGQGKEDARSKREEILATIRLPESAQALRKKGVPKDEVKQALRAAKDKRVKAKDAKSLLDESAKAVDENGRIDNFGMFVKSQLAAGLRGRDLAAAIHAEHKNRGKGHAKGKGASKGKDPSKGKDASKGNDNAKGNGKSKAQGKSKDKGKPKEEDDDEDTQDTSNGEPKEKQPKDKPGKNKGPKGKQK